MRVKSYIPARKAVSLRWPATSQAVGEAGQALTGSFVLVETASNASQLIASTGKYYKKVIFEVLGESFFEIVN